MNAFDIHLRRKRFYYLNNGEEERSEWVNNVNNPSRGTCFL
ncbi:MAG TPA: hypothetical protein VLE50_05720 [Cellvibrio sp.]|nr:hypothetical protein [Cellvibrio sp.]